MPGPGDAALPFRYRSRGRTALNLGLFALGLAMLGLAAAMEGTPPVVFLPLGAFACMMGYLVLRDPRAGLEIDAAAITLRQGRRHERIPLAAIARVQVRHWSDSTEVTIHRRDGGRIDIPDRCRPAADPLTRALEAAGVTVSED